MSSVSFSILSWNTLCAQDPWYPGWGCPLEQERRDALMDLRKDIIREEEDLQQHRSAAEAMLTHERYQRIRTAVAEEMNRTNEGKEEEEVPLLHPKPHPFVDLMLFQELTRDDPWDSIVDNGGVGIDVFSSVASSLYDRIPCQDDDDRSRKNEYDTIQRVYLRKDSSWKATRSFGLESYALEGGCLVELQWMEQEENGNDDEASADTTYNNNNNNNTKSALEEAMDVHHKLYVVNLHGKPKSMRDPSLLRQGMQVLWQEIAQLLRPPGAEDGWDDPDANGSSWKERLVLCGDWNTHLTSLPEAFVKLGQYSNVVPAMLDNQTATNFSTNHEDGFLAQYDGCLLSNSLALQLQSVSRNLTGFMVKGGGGGESGNNNLPGEFSYQHKEGLFYKDAILPGTLASDGLSDHLRIYTRLKVVVADYNG